MPFEDVFQLTTEAPGLSAASKLSQVVTARPGIYDSGLISILDEQAASAFLRGWSWLLGNDPVALATDWQGHVIFWSPKYASNYYLNTQQGKTAFIDKDVGTLFNTVLTKNGVKEKVLYEKDFEVVLSNVGSLQYGECYYAKPWQMLGGSGSLDSYGKGDVEVYLSLTGQTVHKAMEHVRSRRQ